MLAIQRRLPFVMLTTLLLSIANIRDANGQQQACPIVVRTEAVLGEPFGIGMVSFRLPDRIDGVDPNLIIRTNSIQLTEKNGRIFYPAEGYPAAARFFRNVFGGADQPSDQLMSIYFLFHGDAPLDLTLWGCDGIQVNLQPQPVRNQKLQRFFKQWWREYQITVRQQSDFGDFPDLVGTYLVEMLASRLNLERPQPTAPAADPMRRTMELFTDIDPLSSSLIREWYSGTPNFESRDWDPPPGIELQTLPAPVDTKEVIPIEPIAMHVPKDCFYLRFGTWDNQLWLKRLIEEHGGDLGRMVRLRGFKSKVQSKFLNQLALESSQIDEWFGGNLIDDVAVIGRDTYFETGASVGVLLYSKDPAALNTRINQRRKRFVDDTTHLAKIEDVELNGKPATYLSTKDNRYRSFYVNVGNAHLFTTSRSIATAFASCSENGQSLGQSNEFRFARKQMPLERSDTVFVFFSSHFFQGLLRPECQIELLRRSKVITEMQLTQLSQLTARNEGYAQAPMEFLISNGYLPQVLAQRPVASQIEVVDGVWLDQIRGRRGFFIPVADVDIGKISPSENQWYIERAQFFRDYVRHLEPMYLGLQRFDKGSNIERIVFDGRMAPFGQEKYGWLTSMLGAPLNVEVQGTPDDLVRMQLSLKGGLWQRDVPPHQIFAAIQGDVNPDIDLQPSSFFDAWRTLKQVPGYLGTFPKAGTLDRLPRLGGQPDVEGFTYSRMLDLWRLQFGDFSVLAFDQGRLLELKPQLQIVTVERPAQIRLHVGDLSKSDLDGWANVLNYRRAWEASLANAQLLNMIADQFGIEPAAARDVGEQLMDLALICSLGGEYTLQAIPGRSIWVSNAWPNFSAPSVPQDYLAPVLGWFRGLDLEVTHVNSQFLAHGFLDIERSKSTEGILPSFDLFKGFQNLFPSGGTEADN